MFNRKSRKSNNYCPPIGSGEGVNPYDLVRDLDPLVEYGIREGRVTGIRHAMMEVALISYLMGMGFDQETAYQIVESWEEDERFPRGYDM